MSGLFLYLYPSAWPYFEPVSLFMVVITSYILVVGLIYSLYPGFWPIYSLYPDGWPSIRPVSWVSGLIYSMYPGVWHYLQSVSWFQALFTACILMVGLIHGV
jgi:hypothetical protein